MLNVSNPGGGKAATDASMNNDLKNKLLMSAAPKEDRFWHDSGSISVTSKKNGKTLMAKN